MACLQQQAPLVKPCRKYRATPELPVDYYPIWPGKAAWVSCDLGPPQVTADPSARITSALEDGLNSQPRHLHSKPVPKLVLLPRPLPQLLGALRLQFLELAETSQEYHGLQQPPETTLNVCARTLKSPTLEDCGSENIPL